MNFGGGQDDDEYLRSNTAQAQDVGFIEHELHRQLTEDNHSRKGTVVTVKSASNDESPT